MKLLLGSRSSRIGSRRVTCFQFLPSFWLQKCVKLPPQAESQRPNFGVVEIEILEAASKTLIGVLTEVFAVCPP